ncbi:MAG: hypothetical protein IK090_02455, partial [Clostridia bacterium]|nr:hypothetical protein [Clostridia bacterium]
MREIERVCNMLTQFHEKSFEKSLDKPFPLCYNTTVRKKRAKTARNTDGGKKNFHFSGKTRTRRPQMVRVRRRR